MPYQETIRRPAKAHGRHKKQTGGRGQFGDCHIEIEPLEDGEGFEFVNAIKGGVIPTGFIPAVEKGVVEAMQEGVVAGYPVKGVRVRLYDGSYHTVDSSEMAFKVAGSLAMKQAMEQAGPVLLEPIMLVTVSAPEDAVGDVIGDLNSRRGRPLGMEPSGGGMTEVKAEVPMARDAVLRAGPALDHRRPRRVRDGVPALRGGSRPSCRKGRRGRQGRAGGGEGVASGRSTLGAREYQGHSALVTPHLTCDVCGRTLLRGERAEAFLDGGARKAVCELCTSRALNEGWMREGTGADVRRRASRA